MVGPMYPPELQLNKATVSDKNALFIGFTVFLFKRMCLTKIYDKHNDLDLDIVNFPFLNSDVPRSTSYGAYISQLI